MTAPALKINAAARSLPSENMATRHCSFCLRTLPTTDFRIVKKRSGTRSRQCRSCHRDQERYRRQRARETSRVQSLYRSWSTLAHADRRRVAIDELLENLIRQFGGTAALASAWHDAVVEATAVRRIRAVESLVVMMERFEKHEVCVGDLADDQLAVEANNLRIAATIELIRDDPQIAAAICEQLGYRLSRESAGQN